MSNDTVIFTILKNTGDNLPKYARDTYRIVCKNRFRTYNRYTVKNLFKEMSELTNIFNNDIKMGILFEIED